MAQCSYIVVVEDDPFVLEATSIALEKLGFKVHAASTSFAALEWIGQRSEPLVALVTDINLGEGPTGWELACHARRIQPDLPVIYVSGDHMADWPVEGVPLSAMIQKPFHIGQIVAGLDALRGKPDAEAA